MRTHTHTHTHTKADKQTNRQTDTCVCLLLFSPCAKDTAKVSPSTCRARICSFPDETQQHGKLTMWLLGFFGPRVFFDVVAFFLAAMKDIPSPDANVTDENPW